VDPILRGPRARQVSKAYLAHTGDSGGSTDGCL